MFTFWGTACYEILFKTVFEITLHGNRVQQPIRMRYTKNQLMAFAPKPMGTSIVTNQLMAWSLVGLATAAGKTTLYFQQFT